MRTLFASLLCSVFIINNTLAQTHVQSDEKPAQTKIMTLGVFHFAYPNLDAVKTEDKDKISVLDEPFQSEIKAICNSIEEFNPTAIAIEQIPTNQPIIDSLYLQYKSDKLDLKESETYQLGFRIGKQLNLDKIYCINDQVIISAKRSHPYRIKRSHLYRTKWSHAYRMKRSHHFDHIKDMTD